MHRDFERISDVADRIGRRMAERRMQNARLPEPMIEITNGRGQPPIYLSEPQMERERTENGTIFFRDEAGNLRMTTALCQDSDGSWVYPPTKRADGADTHDMIEAWRAINLRCSAANRKRQQRPDTRRPGFDD